jgi:hypothetical protein
LEFSAPTQPIDSEDRTLCTTSLQTLAAVLMLQLAADHQALQCSGGCGCRFQLTREVTITWDVHAVVVYVWRVGAWRESSN